MKYISQHFLSISILLSGVLIFLATWYGFGFDSFQKLLNIISPLSILVALATYFYKKNQDRTVAAIEQISFFRKEIIPEWDKVGKILKEKNNKYIFSRIKLDQTTIEFIKKKYSRNFEDQLLIFFNKFGEQEMWDAKILDSQIVLFNMLEEFALKVFHFGTNEHQALNAARAAFVEIVEKNAVALLFTRDVVVGNQIYSSTISLYRLWKDQVDRSFIVKRLAKFGFITNRQKEEIFEKIKKSSSTKIDNKNSEANPK